ncbi:uncharacterized protein [Palaemon carinicauda]|uniref:uncharacterized protein n=1 Tax=Palaemon carinicauda TaxID=392227 RepID=UPI0035B6075F
MTSNLGKTKWHKSPPLMTYAALLLTILGPTPGCSDEFLGKSPSSIHTSFQESLPPIVTNPEERHFTKLKSIVPKVRRLLKESKAKKVTPGNPRAVPTRSSKNQRAVFADTAVHSQKGRRRRSSSDKYPSNGKKISLDNDFTDYDDMFDYTTFFYSEHYHVFLCNHPPNTFSAEFLQHSEEQCENYNFFYNINELTTYGMCEYIYKIIHGKSFDLEGAWEIMLDDHKFVTLISDEHFVRLCLPLFRRFNSCKEKKYLTICEDERIMFLHSHECQAPSNEDSYFYVSLAQAATEDKYSCFQCICEGYMRIIQTKSAGNITFMVLEKDISSPHEGACQECNGMVNLLYFLARDNQTKCFVNRYFISCYANSLVLWKGNVHENVLKEYWNILPASCKVTEILLTCILGLILLAGVIGNPFVLFITCHRSSIKNWPLLIHHISLVFSDFIFTAFVVFPSFYSRSKLLFSYWYSDLMGDPFENKDCLSSLLHLSNAISFQRMESTEEVISHYYMFQTIIFNTCLVVSILTRFILSLKVLIITTKRNFEIYFSCHVVCVIILMIWTLAIIDGFLFSFDGNGNVINFALQAHHYSFSLSSFRFWPLRTFIIYRVFIYQAICLSTVVISFSLVKKFLRDYTIIGKSFLEPYSKETYTVLISLSVTSLLFLISVSPYLLFHYETVTSQNYFPRWPMIKFASQLLAKAPAAWNPWIYVMTKTITSKWR